MAETNIAGLEERRERFELVERASIEIAESEYSRLLGFPAGYVFEDRARELAAKSRSWYAAHGRPWTYAREVGGLELRDGQVRIGTTDFGSTRLFEQFSEAGVRRAVIAVVSAGPECETKAQELWLEEKPDEYFFLEILGSAVAEHLVMLAGARLCAWADRAGLAVLPHYSPGYTGWDVADQVRLFRVLAETQVGPEQLSDDTAYSGVDALPGPLVVRESGMLQPKKSLIALFGLTPNLAAAARPQVVACTGCAFPRCDYRRAPYREARPLLEDVGSLQPATKWQNVQDSDPKAQTERTNRAALDPNANYTFISRALRKWARERLRVLRLPDGSVKAWFRFDGTTCSNMGQPLRFDYEIELGSAAEGYVIRRLACAPGEEDTGHRFMCAYLRDGHRFISQIAADQPLLGRPLNDVLGWSRVSSPSGCYCEPNGRLHKWGIVLEVLHFHLVNESIGSCHTADG